MDQARQLKLSAVAFTIFWIGGMLWWSGGLVVNIVILSVCGAAGGYFWYRAMHWWFRRMWLLPHDGID